MVVLLNYASKTTRRHSVQCPQNLITVTTD